MLKSKNIYLLLATPILLWLSWPPRFLPFLAFIAFIPLLQFERQTREKPKKVYFWGIYLSLFLFNILNTWWVYHASFGGAVAMLIANTLYMTVPWLFFRITSRHFGDAKGLLALVFLWLAMEQIHFNWDIAWPWLTLGNVLADYPILYQWYEYTGVLGGSLWILALNISIFKIASTQNMKKLWKPIVLMVVPGLISIFLYFSIQNRSSDILNNSGNMVIVQPNVDPYLKFTPALKYTAVEQMLRQAEAAMNEHTEMIIFPETSIVEGGEEANIQNFKSYQMVTAFCKKHPKVKIIAGANTHRFYSKEEDKSLTARTSRYGDIYDSYNTAIYVDSSGVTDFYHKSKLVPGVEKMPYPQLFGFLEYFAIDLGGISGSLGIDNEAKNFTDDSLIYAPMICYESVFPEYVGEFVRKGANVLLIITNDGWWENTAGHKQHLAYASIRAVENRRMIYRSANTGVSAVILPDGRITLPTKYWEEDVIVAPIITNKRITIFARYGNYIGRFSVYFSVFFILGSWVKAITSKVKK
jgi:apolipoprotein N-acyltransferase